MALLPPLANAVRMPGGVDTHPSYFSSHVGASGTENSACVVLKFQGEETFQTPVVELNGASDSQEEPPLPRIRRKRLTRRHTESSSEDDDEHRIKTVRRKSRFNYREADSSSEGEGDHAVAAKTELPYGVLRGCPTCRTCQKVLATWRPNAGRRPCIEEAPVFYPTEEEFQHPMRYISSIRARAELHGICRVVPPQSWNPPCPLRGDSVEVQNMQFPTRVQQVHKLQVRQVTTKECSSTKQTAKKQRARVALGRMGESATFPTPAAIDQPEYFGFWAGEPFLLGAFEKYAKDFKDQYFSISERQKAGPEQEWEPSVENIEGEYWRIVEQATEQIEVLYGADVETGTFGSGFPKPSPGSEAASLYEKSGWNLNNIARYPGSMLSFEEVDISGVLVPWLYVGMCFSSFCWHVEDHHFYSINYMHWGAPKIWYGVPGFAADKLEAAMKKHLPDLFNEQPDLLQKLVTQLSPSFLKREGVPVYRIVQQPGDFVITFPNAYHCGFNAGFNLAEAVNLAPVDWLPHGQAAVERYRELGRQTSVSHDKLLLGAAKVAMRMWWHSQQNEKPLLVRDLAGDLEPGFVCAWQAYCGEGGMLANALKTRVSMEQTRRESLELMTGSTLSMKQMDSSYDSTDERECESCKYDLHLSAVGCECCPEKFACLLHGHLLCSCPWSKKTLFYRYPLEQLKLLLAAVEGRPEAIATWAKQDGEKPSQSPTNLRDVVVPSQILLGNDVANWAKQDDEKSNQSPTNLRDVVLPSQILLGNDVLGKTHSFTSSVVAETVEHMDSATAARTKETALQYVKGLHNVHVLFKSEPDNTTQPAPIPLVSVRNTVAASCENINVFQHNSGLVRQEFMNSPSHSQKVAFLRSGHAKRAAARKSASELAGSFKCSLTRLPGGELGSSRQPALSTSENQRVNVPTPDLILLSDDEEEIPCKLNEAAESSFSGHEMPISFSSRVDDRLVARAHLAESKVDLVKDRCKSLSNDIAMHPACGGSAKILSEENPSQGFVEAAFASDDARQGATPMTVDSPVKERALQSLSSASALLKSLPDGQTASPSPVPGVVTIVQRGAGNALAVPRVPRIRERRDVELLEVGRLVVREGWHTRHAIYPAGFRSRIFFTNFENVLQTCPYVSDIIDQGLGKRPLFKVTHLATRRAFFAESADGCWHAIQNQINESIISLRSQNRNLQLPPLRPPPIGAEMFGLTSIPIIEAVEALDPLHQCKEYWDSKQTPVKQNHGPDSTVPDIRRTGISVACLKDVSQELPPRDLQARAPKHRIVNTSSRIPVNISGTNKPSLQTSLGEIPGRQGILSSSLSNERPDTYSTMQGLFQRATPTELGVLYHLFTSEARGAEWESAFRALKEVQKTFLG